MLSFTFLLFSVFQATFKDECKFNETLLPNNYNAYESSVYKGFYVALSKHGRGKRGNKATTAMTATHFLPRIWADSCNNSSFALISPRDLKTDTQTYKEPQEYHQNSTTSFFYMYIWIGQLFIRISEYAIRRCLLLLFIYIYIIDYGCGGSPSLPLCNQVLAKYRTDSRMDDGSPPRLFTVKLCFLLPQRAT